MPLQAAPLTVFLHSVVSPTKGKSYYIWVLLCVFFSSKDLEQKRSMFTDTDSLFYS